MIRAVLFDIGSTLWSSPPEAPTALAACYGRGRALLASAIENVPPIDRLIDAVEGTFAAHEERWAADPSLVEQPPTTDYVATALAGLGLRPPPALLAAFTEAVLDTSVLTARVEPAEPEMTPALAALRQRGLRLGCVSNAFMPAAVLARILDERGLGDHCELVVSSCEVGYRKPHPAIYEAALASLRLAPAETVFVGDRVVADVAGPAALGMRTVLTHQYKQERPVGGVRPDFVIGHLGELADCLDQLRRAEAAAS
jgi:HAD superfamily hydrolase (TIGR01509 family)